MKRAILLSCTALFLSSSCLFGPSKFRGVMSSRRGMVFLQGGGYYKVGALPDGWRRMDVRKKVISFYNPSYLTSVTTDAFCGPRFSERPLDTLAGELASALSDRKTVSTKNLELDGRAGLRLLVKGKIDGVDTNMDIVVVKKDACVFDFVAVSPPDAPSGAISDFETFFNGFRY